MTSFWWIVLGLDLGLDLEERKVAIIELRDGHQNFLRGLINRSMQFSFDKDKEENKKGKIGKINTNNYGNFY